MLKPFLAGQLGSKYVCQVGPRPSGWFDVVCVVCMAGNGQVALCTVVANFTFNLCGGPLKLLYGIHLVENSFCIIAKADSVPKGCEGTSKGSVVNSSHTCSHWILHIALSTMA